METELDIDDAAEPHPLAKQELATLRANLARVTSERDEEVQSNVELREKLYNVRNDNDRLRDALREAANLLRRIAKDELREGKSPMAATQGAEAAEAALKGGE